MALSGTLSDLGIVDLIQFPSAGRKTGELIVAGDEDEARIYYTKGKLEHIVLGDLLGMDALVELVSWEEGEFEFRLDVANNDKSIEIDLHRALMLALKTRDELAEQKRKQKDEQHEEGIGEGTRTALREFVESTSYVQGAYLLSNAGKVAAVATNDGDPPEKCEGLAEQLIKFGESYKRPGFKRLMVEDELGTIVIVRQRNGNALLLVAGKEASLGAASMSSSRLSTALEESAK